MMSRSLLAVVAHRPFVGERTSQRATRELQNMWLSARELHVIVASRAVRRLCCICRPKGDGGAKKPRRLRPGTRALREIKK